MVALSGPVPMPSNAPIAESGSQGKEDAGDGAAAISAEVYARGSKQLARIDVGHVNGRARNRPRHPRPPGLDDTSRMRSSTSPAAAPLARAIHSEPTRVTVTAV